MLMEVNMKEEKNIPFKNYIILSFVLLISIVIVIYFYMWYGELQLNKISTPVVDKYLSVVNYNELDTYLIENKDVIIYVSVLDDYKTRNFEKKFVKIIDEYSLSNILYLNLTEEYKNKRLFDEIESKYKLLDTPCIIIFKDGIVIDVYSIEDRNYDTDLLISYLRIKGVIND